MEPMFSKGELVLVNVNYARDTKKLRLKPALFVGVSESGMYIVEMMCGGQREPYHVTIGSLYKSDEAPETEIDD